MVVVVCLYNKKINDNCQHTTIEMIIFCELFFTVIVIMVSVLTVTLDPVQGPASPSPPTPPYLTTHVKKEQSGQYRLARG